MLFMNPDYHHLFKPVFDSPVFLYLDEALRAQCLRGLKRFGVSFMMCVHEPPLSDFLLKSRKIDTFGLASPKPKNA